MAFAQRFNEVTTDITHISELAVHKAYPIECADRVTTRFGDTILPGIRDLDTPDERLYKVFLPQRYCTAFKDDDLQAINDGTARWRLVSKKSVRSRVPLNCLLSDTFRFSDGPVEAAC